ncbi:LrgB family protein [Neisseria gonorrhoeae]|uniref:LrgB family protein n=1 Tax=Neisseria gonorrhoeae TaxID=485 RepID=UPI0021E07499|nr:LrgB family protein [Neisseria gonorrhoeae]MCU9831688.1 LrgB family protein [Neisseria gonorrhoeae]MCU9861724.1 LrgB family protein [Neisseria gonorrhoeae]MCU9873070.1 LrgB family protein [Neisseria gonorrhoeae]MCU9877011.1 LrgB family protein [Neisseria gonorrhoeae]MCU9884021.1 LrgB family protein [Neisseria gonorrhoeae]
MSEILRQPGILLFLTLAVYALAIIVRTRTGNIFCNPIAIEITSSIGGIPAITAATVIIAGLVGQIAGYKMLKNTVVMPSSVGMSLGTASHAMGIAASLERSRRMAAYAGMGLTFNGVLTALIAPLLIPVLGF